MKINQILKENTLNPDYIPNDYILSQLRVSTIREFNNIRDQYQFPHLQDLDKYEIGPYQQVFKFNTTPDWDLSAYCYDTVYDKLLLIYPGMEDSYLAVETISSTHNNKTRMCMSFPNREWYDRQIEKAKEDKII